MKNKRNILIIISIILVLAIVFILINRKKVDNKKESDKDINEDKIVLKDTTNIEYLVKRIDNEIHLLEISSKEIKDVHVFSNVNVKDINDISFFGFSNNKGYYSVKETVYYFDRESHKEFKWLDISLDVESDDGTEKEYIYHGFIMNNKLYFSFSDGIYSIDLNAKNADKIYDIREFLEKNNISLLSLIDETYYDNNKLYFEGRDDSKNTTEVYIYEFDSTNETITSLVGGNLDNIQIMHYLYNNGYIFYDNANEKMD